MCIKLEVHSRLFLIWSWTLLPPSYETINKRCLFRGAWNTCQGSFLPFLSLKKVKNWSCDIQIRKITLIIQEVAIRYNNINVINFVTMWNFWVWVHFSIMVYWFDQCCCSLASLQVLVKIMLCKTAWELLKQCNKIAALLFEMWNKRSPFDDQFLEVFKYFESAKPLTLNKAWHFFLSQPISK